MQNIVDVELKREDGTTLDITCEYSYSPYLKSYNHDEPDEPESIDVLRLYGIKSSELTEDEKIQIEEAILSAEGRMK